LITSIGTKSTSVLWIRAVKIFSDPEGEKEKHDEAEKAHHACRHKMMGFDKA
jgi:hypothetical protein